jgi:hypothetical protein
MPYLRRSWQNPKSNKKYLRFEKQKKCRSMIS